MGRKTNLPASESARNSRRLECAGSSLNLGLPNMHPVARIKIETISGLDAKCGVPGVDIANDAVDPERRRAVGVGREIGAQRLVPDILPVGLRPRQEDAL